MLLNSAEAVYGIACHPPTVEPGEWVKQKGPGGGEGGRRSGDETAELPVVHNISTGDH